MGLLDKSVLNAAKHVGDEDLGQNLKSDSLAIAGHIGIKEGDAGSEVGASEDEGLNPEYNGGSENSTDNLTDNLDTGASKVVTHAVNSKLSDSNGPDAKKKIQFT